MWGVKKPTQLPIFIIHVLQSLAPLWGRGEAKAARTRRLHMVQMKVLKPEKVRMCIEPFFRILERDRG